VFVRPSVSILSFEPTDQTTYELYFCMCMDHDTACYSAPDRGAEYCDERVCLRVSVCVRLPVHNHIFGTTRQIFAIFVRVIHCRGSVLLWRRTDTLHISGFMHIS